MSSTKIIVKYNIDWCRKPYCTQDTNPQGMMEFCLESAFKTHNGKPSNVLQTRKIMKVILKCRSDENIQQVQDYLLENSPLWMVEFKKLLEKKGV